MVNPETVELRGQAPRELVDVLDAVSTHRHITRTDLVNEILAKWAEDKLHEATLVIRITNSNGRSRTAQDDYPRYRDMAEIAKAGVR